MTARPSYTFEKRDKENVAENLSGPLRHVLRDAMRTLHAAEPPSGCLVVHGEATFATQFSAAEGRSDRRAIWVACEVSQCVSQKAL